MKLKWKVILGILTIVLLVWTGLVVMVYFEGQRDLEQAIENRISTASGIVSTLEEGLYPSYQRRIRSLIDPETSGARREMLRAFHQRDKATLQRLSMPFYKTLTTEKPYFKSFAWILPDNRAFLRLHLLKLADDDVAEMRPDIAAANQRKQMIAAYSTSGMGVGYHVSVPVFWEGEYSGVLQWGVDAAQLVNLLNERLAVPCGILIPQEKARFIKAKFQQFPLLKLSDFAVLSAEPEAFDLNVSGLDWHAERSWFVDQGRQYALVRLLPLLDYNQEPAGHIIAKLDLSAEYQAAQVRFWTVLVISTLLLLALFFLLYISFRHLLKEIFLLNKSLEEQNATLEQRVEKRSAELKKSQDEWVAMFNAIPDLVTVQNKNMEIIAANQAVCDFFQMPAEQIIGKHCHSLYFNSTEPCSNQRKNELLTKSAGFTTIVTHEKLNKTFQVTAAPIYTKEGQVESFVHIVKDITEKKRLEEDLVQAQKMEAIGTLAGGIAHDFNNILSAIIGYATMAKMRETAPNRLTSDLDNILKAGNRAADLVKQILTFSRKDTSSEELFQPHLLLTEVIKMLRSSIPSTIEISTDINPQSGWINASQVRLHQVIMNLCTNAVQAMANEKGKLKVQLRPQDVGSDEIVEAGVEPGRFVMLSVSDTGSGMDSQTLERIFDPYFTTKAGEQGTGLGLAVVHGIVRDLKGFIRVTSVPAQGSRFDIYLPTVRPHEESAQQHAVELNLPRGNERLLVVDDEESIIEIIQAMLQELGYQVDIEQSSQQALHQLRLQPERYDLIITDQTMPELTGQELAAELYQLTPQLPLILCTGYSSVIKGQRNQPSGIRRVMTKPLQLAELAAAVRQALDESDG